MLQFLNMVADILSHLNPAQQAAVCFDTGPLLVLAGPGSGKTRVLTHRAAWLVKEKKVSPNQILLLTFTNKAAEEMKKRILKLIGDGSLPFAGTFHSFCARVLRQEGRAVGLKPNFLIYNQKDQLETIKEAMAGINLSHGKYSPGLVLKTISQAKNELISALEYPQYAQGEFQDATARIYLTYQRFLLQYQALDFDDLLLQTVKLFKNRKLILGKYQEQICYLLIDEYQDTNQAQYELTRLLAGRWRNLCIVGDASQAIYGFRGANYRNLINLKNDFPDLKTINLEQNYRSTQTILTAAYQVVNKNTLHPILKLWTKKKKGGLIGLYQASTQTEEAFFVINTIRQLVTERGYHLADFAVLYRTNAQSRVLEEAFLQAGLVYSLIGGVRFYERKEIKDCLAYLRLLANSLDAVSLKRVTRLGKRRLVQFQTLAKRLKQKNLTTLEILDLVLETVSYWDRFDEKDPQGLARLENIKELRSVAALFPQLTDFLENVSLVEQEYIPAPGLRKGKSMEAVTLMTAHAAKGTEFPVVFLVGMEEGLFPHLRSLGSQEEIEEERRLCYVGLTRAKEKIYLTFASRRLYFGQYSANPVSRFVADLPPELIESVSQEGIMSL